MSGSGTGRGVGVARPARARLVTRALVTLALLGLDGCSSADPRVGPDCVSPFHFDDREYRLGPQPPDVDRVKPGALLGEGANESCDQYAPGDRSPGDGSDRLTEPRPVYAYPEVPAEQAVLLVTPDGRHVTVLLASVRPEGGWDPDLKRWLRDHEG